uniref:Zinc-ribbon 15 domain-containing protein n=2 Tax=Oryzeae TaxID=147380 RepID=A0A0E0LM91_ORYPU
MVFFCFLVDQRRKVRSSKPAAGICSRCGGCASVADMETATRVCYLLTVHRATWRAIICTFCGAMLKSYRHYRLYTS